LYKLIEKYSGERLRQQYVDLCNDRWDASMRYSSLFREKTLNLYRLYRGLLSGNYHLHKHNIHLPLIFSTIQSDIAKKLSATFGVYPYVDFQPRPGSEPAARKQSQLFQSQFDADDGRLKAVDLYTMADLYGLCPGIDGWRKETHKAQFTDIQTSPLTGKRVQVIAEMDEYVDFDGPSWQPLDPMDFGPQPLKIKISDMDYAQHEYTIDLEYCRMLMEQGVFEKDEFERMVSEGGGASDVIETVKNRRGYPLFTMNDWSSAPDDTSLRPVTCRDMVGLIPQELAINGVNRVILTVANDRYLLRARPLSRFDQKLPYWSTSPNPDPHFFWAMGKGEVLEKIQIAANKFTNQHLDFNQLLIDPMWVVSRQANLDPANLFSRPGRVFQVDGIPQERWMPLPLNTAGAQLSTQVTEILWRWGQLGTGTIEDTVQGVGNSSRTTAREFVGRQESSLGRLGFEAQTMEMQWLEPLAERFIDHDRQFLDLPHEFQVLGDAARIDPITGKPVEPISAVALPDDLSVRFRAKARGAGSRLSMAARQQNAIMLTQTLGAIPAAQAALNWIGWCKMLGQMFEMPSVLELINTNEQASQMLDRLAPKQQQEAANPNGQLGQDPMQMLEALGATQ
jgi:hypothetical protein